VSSVATAPGGASSRPSRTTVSGVVDRGQPRRDFVAGLIVALLLCLIAFLATGGVDLAPNTWVQVGLVVIAAATAVAVVVLGAPGRFWGGATLALFAALAALTYASIAWSVQPANSWLEANRTLSYLAAFATALMLARLFPGAWRGLVGGIAVATTVICGYALLVKVFPGSFDPNDPLGRLRAPFDYWNAVGLLAALGIPACLWAGARRDGSLWLRALAVPAIAVLLSALLLAASRGAVLAAVVGLVVWFVLSPHRLRSVLILALGGAGGAAVAAWGLSTRGISSDGVAIATRTSAGHAFGVVLVVAVSLAAAAGIAGALALDRLSLSARARHAIGLGLLGGVALLPVAAVAALAASSRGLTGEVSHIWTTLTNTNGGSGDQPGRLVQLSNSRPHYWSQAIQVGEQHLLAGVGALGFGTARPTSSHPVSSARDAQVVHAHGYLAETFADFGLIGLAVSLALFAAWAVGTARTFGLSWPRRPLMARPPPSGNGQIPRGAEPTSAATFAAERVGLIALLAVVVTFGVHSLIDWTWFVPGVAVPALACAGWLAGRGPLSAPVGRLPRARHVTRPAGVAAGAAAVVVLTVVAVWVIVQPLRSFDSLRSAETAAYAGDASAALTDARTAATEDPVSIEPLFLLSTIYTHLGDPASARRELIDATRRQPANPQTWQELGCFDYVHHDARASLELARLVNLAPTETHAQTDPVAYCASVLG
jgi:O-Antigen ligase